MFHIRGITTCPYSPITVILRVDLRFKPLLSPSRLKVFCWVGATYEKEKELVLHHKSGLHRRTRLKRKCMERLKGRKITKSIINPPEPRGQVTGSQNLNFVTN
jgi:hypothetical protein